MTIEHLDFEPEDPDTKDALEGAGELVEGTDEFEIMLPEKCRGCKHAEFMIMMLTCFSPSTGGPDWVIEDIRERCTGYIRDPEPSGIREIETPEGTGFFVPFSDKSGCPYAQLPDEDIQIR